MPPKKKQPKPSAFICYANDWKREREAEGMKFPNGMKYLVELASPSWNELKPAARARYEEMAKGSKNVPIKKFTSLGESFDDVMMRQEEVETKKRREANDVTLMLTKLGIAGKYYLAKEFFFLVDINWYCVASDVYVPNEFSIMAFNLEDGIQDVCHTIIDPGYIPMGFASDAKESFSEHHFPLPPYNIEGSQSDYKLIFACINVYIANYARKGARIPPLFTMPGKVAAVTSFFDQMCYQAVKELSDYRIYKLNDFFYKLCSEAASSAEILKFSLAEDVLERNTFQYTPGLACKFHEPTDVYHKCTQARVKQWAFIIMDYCLAPLKIRAVPGQHLPAGIDLAGVAKLKEEKMKTRQEDHTEERNFTILDYSEKNIPVPRWTAQGPAVAFDARAWGVCPDPEPEIDSSTWPSLGGPPAAPAGAWGPKVSSSTRTAPPMRKPTTQSITKAPKIDPVNFPNASAGRGRGRELTVDERLRNMKLE